MNKNWNPDQGFPTPEQMKRMVAAEVLSSIDMRSIPDFVVPISPLPSIIPNPRQPRRASVDCETAAGFHDLIDYRLAFSGAKTGFMGKAAQVFDAGVRALSGDGKRLPSVRTLRTREIVERRERPSPFCPTARCTSDARLSWANAPSTSYPPQRDYGADEITVGQNG